MSEKKEEEHQDAKKGIDTVDSSIRYVGYGQRAKQLINNLKRFAKLDLRTVNDVKTIARESAQVSKDMKLVLSSSVSQVAKNAKTLDTAKKEFQLMKPPALNSVSQAIAESKVIKPALKNAKVASGLTKRLVDLQEMALTALKKKSQPQKAISQDSTAVKAPKNLGNDIAEKKRKHKDRSLATQRLIRACNFLSWSYIVGDVSYETFKAYEKQKVYSGEAEDNSLSEKSLDAHGLLPTLDYRYVFLERSIFHSITTILIPTIAIRTIIKYSATYIFNSQNYSCLLKHQAPLGKDVSQTTSRSFLNIIKSNRSALQELGFYRFGPFITVSILFPLIPRYTDKKIEKLLYNSFYAFQGL